MTRHSKNCTANSVYSYHEKQKDGQASGFGSLKIRFSKDAVKDFDCCCLTLHPCRDPVLTPDGFLFDKEAILEYILAKKAEIRRKMKEYERQCKKEKAELEELGEAERRSKLDKFLKDEASVGAGPGSPRGIAQTPKAGSSSGQEDDAGSASVSNMVPEKAKKLPSFWLPSLTPENGPPRLQKPDTTVPCPMSGRPLRLKDLIPIKWTPASPGGSGSLEGRRERYKCPVTGDILGNHVPCAALVPTGHVVTIGCVDLIRKDMLHPLTGAPLREKDIIPLQRGGTGFSSVNQELVAEKARPVMQT